MRVLVCGGRDYDDVEAMVEALAEFPRDTVIIHGGARGADYLAESVAICLRMKVVTFKADWKRHGRAAGPIRNRQMLAEGKPDLVLAFPGGRGTADMVTAARAAGVPVRYALAVEEVREQ